MTESFMTTKSPGFQNVPDKIQELAIAAERSGFCNFWYSEQYGLYADAPTGTIYDDRVLVRAALVGFYWNKFFAFTGFCHFNLSFPLKFHLRRIISRNYVMSVILSKIEFTVKANFW